MKAGFINAHCRKPAKKYYSYHGEVRDCLIEPDPGPFDEYPLMESGLGWVLMVDQVFNAYPYVHWKYASQDYPISPDPDNCYWASSQPTRRYYFCEMRHINRSVGRDTGFIFVHQAICSNKTIGTKRRGIYKAWLDSFNPLTNIYITSYYCWGTHIKVWSSLDGRDPGFYPVPIDEYIFD